MIVNVLTQIASFNRRTLREEMRLWLTWLPFQMRILLGEDEYGCSIERPYDAWPWYVMRRFDVIPALNRKAGIDLPSAHCLRMHGP